MFYLEVRQEVKRYRLFVPLVEGFTGGRSQASVGDVADKFELWIKDRGEKNRPYFTGVVVGGESIDRFAHERSDVIGVFGWHDGKDFVSMQEGNAFVEFSSHPELHEGLNDENFMEMLHSLATLMGTAFKQKRIYVFDLSKSELMIFQEEGSRTPTQQS